MKYFLRGFCPEHLRMAGLQTQQQGLSGSKPYQSSSSNSKASGLAASKVIYKRRRAARRVPTTILETSCQDFRDAVQKLTGFHRPKPANSAKQQQSKTVPGYLDEDRLDDYKDAEAEPQVHNSPQSVLPDSTSELPNSEFFQHFLRSNMAPSKHVDQDRAKFDAASLRGARFPPYPNVPASVRGAPYGFFGGPSRTTMPMLWEGMGSDFMSSIANFQDPSLAPNPYLIALENQLLAKFARRMQTAASNPLDPWYPMEDNMPPSMRA